MIRTESRVWQKLKTYGDRFTSLERVESPITIGCSDVSYVGPSTSGWIELKTCNWPAPRKPIYLHAPFTLAQSNWLREHHDPEHNLHSYLLIAVVGARTWKEFLLIDPNPATFLLAGWRGMAHERLLTKRGVRRCATLDDVVNVVTNRRRKA